VSETPPDRGRKAQRLRVRFARGPQAAQIGHLDFARRWEGAFCDAGVPVTYSQGNRRQPRITIAAGLPAGATSEGELLDVIVAERLEPAAFAARVQPCLPDGLTIRDVHEVGIGLPSLPSAVRWADYEVDLLSVVGAAAAIDSFLVRETVPWTDTRGEKKREYDLRPLVRDLGIDAAGDGVARLTMRLRCDTSGSGRPDQVVKALGLPDPPRIHRTRLVLAEASPAREAWRRRGRYVE
jgi:radical SAM-linked protein